ncbi:hypothetical protein CERSUDRAFT_121244 [Gelatoporia subvermispora B]|uniref:Amidohydrolase-related domain-containing protein n=1 Tax=Ceriporiopsis subvermispora (strain B) TaxID=914234 RepID=M2RPY9_CERS8|nr:hypothetical protein CERSUDRAFT_121244 [Gelatoporia subvermispora B]
MASKVRPLEPTEAMLPTLQPTFRSVPLKPLLVSLCAVVASVTVVASNVFLRWPTAEPTANIQRAPINAQQILNQCTSLRATPGPPEDFLAREASDRFQNGTKPTLIRNAAIWTGARNGTETVFGDVLLDKGIVKGIGYIPVHLCAEAEELQVVDAKGGWVTPGLVDIHSHVGIFSVPFAETTSEINSRHGPIVPWLRSIDALHTHDAAFQLAVAGGVTTVQVLPGSANAIAGQAFMVKLRETAERSPTSMLLEPPFTLNGTVPDSSAPLRWRHLKQACGENLIRYGNRMDSVWSFRAAYDHARKIMTQQNAFCAKAEAGLWDELKDHDYPEDLQWEVMVDVLRGRVKVATHCYEAVDIDDMVRISNEFQFPIASFQHAAEAWMVPDVIKRTWGGTPAVAVFATSGRYKLEAYRASEFAPRVLVDNGIEVIMKTDHPALNARYLLYEAQVAHHFGLPPHLALASVTSVPAAAVGMQHRIGLLREGADADVVLWDSYPLQLGATPRKVWIDGILQVGSDKEHVIIGRGKDGREWQANPKVPNWDEERNLSIKWDGLPPLTGKKYDGRVLFTNVRELWVRGEDRIEERFSGSATNLAEVTVERGRVSCVSRSCAGRSNVDVTIDLHGGSISPSFMAFGSPLGLEEIQSEPSTGNGAPYDPFIRDVPDILGDTGGVVRTVDGLQFGTRDALIAYRAGVTYATTAVSQSRLTGPQPVSPIAGLSATFRTGSAHALAPNAVVKPITALHVIVSKPPPFSWMGASPVSVSTQIAALRRLLLDGENERTETGQWFKKAAEGTIPIVVDVSSADIMATLLRLKREVEDKRGSFMNMVFARATEAYLLADEIAQARVGVIMSPPRPFPTTWDDRRILPGPPLTNDTALAVLLDHKVKVAIGNQEAWQARNTRFDIAWAALESDLRISRVQAYALASTNLEKMLGVDEWVGYDGGDLVAYDGGSAFEFASKVVAVTSPAQGSVEVF